jgi:hypothetical protein
LDAWIKEQRTMRGIEGILLLGRESFIMIQLSPGGRCRYTS